MIATRVVLGHRAADFFSLLKPRIVVLLVVTILYLVTFFLLVGAGPFLP